VLSFQKDPFKIDNVETCPNFQLVIQCLLDPLEVKRQIKFFNAIEAIEIIYKTIKFYTNNSKIFSREHVSCY